jgi:hypothetical protein
MRDFYNTIQKVIEMIPEENQEFLQSLKSVQDSSLYTAPEMMGERWFQASKILGEFLPVPENLNE